MDSSNTVLGVLYVNSTKIYGQLIYAETKEFLSELYTYNYANIKGEALSLQSYNCLGHRTYSDIDILIPKSSVIAIEKILEYNGFCAANMERFARILHVSSSHQTTPYIKQYKGFKVNVDINFDIFWGEYKGERISIEEFLSDTQEINIYGVTVKVLPPLKAMVQLILHHYKDMNSIFLLATRKSIKHNMFKDVFNLLTNNLETISINRLHAISEKYSIVPYVYYILYHTGLIYDNPILRKYITSFKTPEGEALLNCYGLNETERREWNFDFRTRLESKSL